jgi:hypothetical protein
MANGLDSERPICPDNPAGRAHAKESLPGVRLVCRTRAEITQHLQAVPRGTTLRLPSTQQEEVMTMIVAVAASAGSTRA